MAKKTWDAFVEQHGSGHCLTTGINNTANAKPVGLGKNGLKMPTYREMANKVVAGIAKDDWATRTEETTTARNPRVKGSKAQRLSAYHYIFKSPTDCMAVSKAFGVSMSALTPRGNAPCVTQDQARAIDQNWYTVYAKHFGYM